ncbi:conserved hypothetical protein [Cupriavidus phytorum]|uniref:Uncharacterized protein n=1 Tax=Cupriavidus taiwanensis TaxID=164546 RepID=A0A375CNA0_9BURK|nr:conserved hypothetical protein [Cupriavidus taiwanensis]
MRRARRRKGPWQGSRKSVDVMPGARSAARRDGRCRASCGACGTTRLRPGLAHRHVCIVACRSRRLAEIEGHLAFTRRAAAH